MYKSDFIEKTRLAANAAFSTDTTTIHQPQHLAFIINTFVCVTGIMLQKEGRLGKMHDGHLFGLWDGLD